MAGLSGGRERKPIRQETAWGYGLLSGVCEWAECKVIKYRQNTDVAVPPMTYMVNQ